jgi:hypothetical protein
MRDQAAGARLGERERFLLGDQQTPYHNFERFLKLHHAAL